MELILEFLFELIFEGGIELSKSSKIPKYIRYPIIGIISLFAIAVISFIFVAGFLSFKENKLISVFLISVGLFLSIVGVVKFKQTYLSGK